LVSFFDFIFVTDYLSTAVAAARSAGEFIKGEFGSELQVNEMKAHDIKLEMDVRSQALIAEIILGDFPEHCILGEEGDSNQGGDGEVEWIVDPIDGTVNYFYGIPHFCVSIAARERSSGRWLVGVIYDPMQDELWQIEAGGKPLLNGREIRVSRRAELSECVMTVGFSKSKEALTAGFGRFQRVSREVRKTRMLGRAALAMAYIACGRLDAYIEEQISLWDVAAGMMLVEAAGGRVTIQDGVGREGTFFICATNGSVRVEDFL